MKRWLSIVAAAGLLLSPVLARAAEPDQSSATQNPPVEQALVREGDFAIKLAAELNLGNTDDESAAEALLASAGVAPKNGWISDYPVTPQIIGQLNDAITQAAADGTVNAAVANQVLDRVVAELSLPEPAGTEPAGGAVAPSNPTTVNNYYANEGPPIVTYYPPPIGYAYLYDWVPYPAFWYGYWFPGFYICHDFTTIVYVTDSHGHHGHGHGHGPEHGGAHGQGTRTAVVSNHFSDPVSGQRAAVDPGIRARGDTRPSTILRSEGRSFMTVADLRQGRAISGMIPVGSRGGLPRGDLGRPAMMYNNQGRSSGAARSTMMNRSSGIPQAPRFTGRPVMRDVHNPGFSRPAMHSQGRAYGSAMMSSRGNMGQTNRFTGSAPRGSSSPGFGRGAGRPGRG